MTRSQYITSHIVGLIVAATVVGLLIYWSLPVPKQAIGSVEQGHEYQGTTTDASIASIATLDPVPGALAQVTITTTGTGSITLYDATTSDNTLRKSAATSTLVLANFVTTGTVGTYTFDRVFFRGLLLVLSGSNTASTTITWR